jgi:hypothetical protein
MEPKPLTRDDVRGDGEGANGVVAVGNVEAAVEFLKFYIDSPGAYFKYYLNDDGTVSEFTADEIVSRKQIYTEWRELLQRIG